MRNLLLLLLIFSFAIFSSSTQAAPPNFLVILCDDLGYGDLECYGHPNIKTPNLNQLAKEGIRFTDFYSAAPVCSPARVGLLTGKTPNRLGIYDWIPPGHPMYLKSETPTIASLLGKAGYETAVVGKWHCNGEFNSPNQDQPDDNGFQHWFATQNNAAPRHENPVNFVRNGTAVGPLEGFSCQLVTDEAIRWLNDRKDSEKPFFLHVCFHEPHEPVESPDELVEQYLDVAENRDQAQYFANVANVDKAVGRLMKQLDQLGLNEETLVIFTSDNGPETLNRYRSANRSYGSPGDLRGMKLHIYDGGIRVAGIARWTGTIAENQTSSVPACSLDFLPTFCSLADVEISDDLVLDGTDISGLLQGEKLTRQQPLFWHYYRAYSVPKIAMRDGDWKIVAHWDGPHLIEAGNSLGRGVNTESQKVIKTAQLVKYELYNLADDPSETNDLAEQELKILKRMQDQVVKKYQQVQSECPVWETDEYWQNR
ncbi:sulfatase-like hydrolase/transferase [Rubinisphaera sp.]|uniref:sulfatase-like hydrolase/transferase n=1 Tax=Rubinisphaera sp. TaxID=2024857 RepID=UPI000C10CA7C|nr:sulfatase-like hydrolase/transferase [Rubinisphaera sp.]MBV08634.1 arylsulfatase [Rubinisphaera sp.]HCS51947.1 arylsulfatase [Planctomycetaceae bacterium]|tara:strand:- start:12655 stop:14100 length:1446 start_codon:yes stop_codon:yes gene_type:complete